MRAGALRNVISIEQEVETGRTSMNTKIVSWQPVFASVFCEKTSRRGTEQFDPASKQRFSQVVFRFRCRFLEVEGINTAMRIDHEGQKYNIKSILPDDQRQDDCIIEATLQDGSV